MKLDQRLSARELLDEIHTRGGRTFRYRKISQSADAKAPIVFVLTTDPTLVEWMRERGAKPSADSHGRDYLRARGGTREWDLVISSMLVSDENPEHAIWEAAANAP